MEGAWQPWNYSKLSEACPEFSGFPSPSGA